MNLGILLLFAALQVVKFGPGGRFQLEYSKESFGLRSHGMIEPLGPHRTKFYPLRDPVPPKIFGEVARYETSYGTTCTCALPYRIRDRQHPAQRRCAPAARHFRYVLDELVQSTSELVQHEIHHHARNAHVHPDWERPLRDGAMPLHLHAQATPKRDDRKHRSHDG